jgi:glycosyltransferase involved in cell wall biosynthesis
MERWALRRAAIITVNSTAAIGFLGRYYGQAASKIRYIPNGVDPLSGRLPERNRAREELGLHPTAPVLLGLFRLSPEKELDLFCSVAEAAFENLPDGRCLIAGDGPLREWLRERVSRSSNRELFRLMGPRDDVSLLLAAADALMLTSRSEGMPNSVLEAMSAGLPVVATRVGGLVDLVEEGATGYLRELDDRAGLISACRSLLLDAAARERMGTRAMSRVESEFSVESMVEAYERLYDQLLPAGSGAGIHEELT